MRNIDRQAIKQEAREQLRGRVFRYFIPIFVSAIVIGLIEIAAVILKHTLPDYYKIEYYITTLGTVYAFLLLPIRVGLSLYFINVWKKDEGFGNVFGTFGGGYDYGTELLSIFLRGLFIVLGTICFIVPGIIIALKYSLLDYVLADYPKLDRRDAMRKCAEITKGRKGEIFCLGFSFFLWLCLCAITCGIAYIYVSPYMRLTFSKFYLECKATVEGEINAAPSGFQVPPAHPYSDFN